MKVPIEEIRQPIVWGKKVRQEEHRAKRFLKGPFREKVRAWKPTMGRQTNGPNPPRQLLFPKKQLSDGQETGTFYDPKTLFEKKVDLLQRVQESRLMETEKEKETAKKKGFEADHGGVGCPGGISL